MIVFKLPKRPWDEAYFGFNFATYPLDAGVTVSSAAFSVEVVEGADPAASSMISGSAVLSGTKAKQKLVAGLDGVKYVLHCRAVMSDGQKLEECGEFWVRDCA